MTLINNIKYSLMALFVLVFWLIHLIYKNTLKCIYRNK